MHLGDRGDRSLPGSAALDPRLAADLATELRHWQVVLRLPEVDPDDYAELADYPTGYAEDVLRALAESELAPLPALVEHLERHESDWLPADQHLLRVLARTGHPLVGPLVERHLLTSFEKSDWEIARQFWEPEPGR